MWVTRTPAIAEAQNLETQRDAAATKTPHRRGRRGRRGRREKRRQGVVFPSQNRRRLRRLSGLALQRKRRILRGTVADSTVSSGPQQCVIDVTTVKILCFLCVSRFRVLI